MTVKTLAFAATDWSAWLRKVSRLARNNVGWYRLLDLWGMTDTLIGDSDEIYRQGVKPLLKKLKQHQINIMHYASQLISVIARTWVAATVNRSGDISKP
jgi:hypothetical protein